MEVRHLRSFVAVARHQHFARAAAALQLTPAPVSRAIAELESELGGPLFVRAHHSVTLTAAGEAMLSRARRLLREWSSFTDHGRALATANAARASMRVGSPTLAPTNVVDAVTAALARAEPQTTVEVDFSPTGELLSALRRGDLDLVIALLPLDCAEDLWVAPVAPYPYGVALPTTHHLAAHSELRATDLCGERVLLPSASLSPHAVPRAEQRLRSVGATIEQRAGADLVRVAQLVRQGVGIALCGRFGVGADMFRSNDTSVIPLDDPELEGVLALVWRRDHTEHSSFAVVAEALEASFCAR